MRQKATNAKRAKVAAGVAALVLASCMSFNFVSASANIADVLDTTKKYDSEYNSMNEVLEAGKELNLQLAAEGFVLLKNKDNALPLAKSERKVTVLGSTADTLATGGGGSGSQSTPSSGGAPDKGGDTSVAGEQSTIFDSLEAVGIKANPRVRDRYLTVNPEVMPHEPGNFVDNTYENGKYMNKVESNGEVEFAGNQYTSITDGSGSLSGADTNLSLYDDAAVVVITRSGSEGADGPAREVAGHSDPNEHYLELNDSEKELFAYAKKNFDKIIVIINSPSVMELGVLEDDDDIDAMLWIGQPGWNGVMAVGEILVGNINPSGRTVDFYMKDFTTDPVWYNSNSYLQAAYALYGDDANLEELGVNKGNVVKMNLASGSALDFEVYTEEHVIDYAEGIYTGYRYYETVAAELGEAGEEWYSQNVVYPFGYGLSYTTFSQEITKVEGNMADADGKIKVDVKVTNTGYVSGKEVVQLYNTAPYTRGGIEKAACDLVGYTKTEMLNPGQSQTVSVEISVKDLASFDYNDANENDNCGYELEEGKYILSVRDNSHVVLDEYELTANELLTWDEDGNPDTPNNIYSQPLTSEWGQFNTLAQTWTTDHIDRYLSREDLVDDGEVADLKPLAWLIENDGTNNHFIDEAVRVLNSRWGTNSNVPVSNDHDNVLTEEKETDYENLWVKDSVPDTWTQGAGQKGENGLYPIVVADMTGIPYDDPQWDTFMNQFTWDELKDAISHGMHAINAVEEVGLDSQVEHDGPGQLKGRDNAGKPNLGNGWAWACAVVQASTWNLDLAYKQGRVTGNESLWLNQSGWYGPAMNIHRSPLSGRNFEYYSQDGVQGGLFAAAVIKGATDMGCHVYAKHAFLNDQEVNRNGAITFATEQAIRQIYAKPFELAIKLGNCNGTMGSFNLIGVSSPSGYATVIQLYKNEWGLDGLNVTDSWGGSANGKCAGWTSWSLPRSYTIPLGNPSWTIEGTWDATLRDNKGGIKDAQGNESPTQWFYVRETAKTLMYTLTNGNAMNNGLYDAAFPDKSYSWIAGTSVEETIVTDEVKDVFGATGYTLEVTSGRLPAGMSIDETSGKLIGVPTSVGETSFDITITGKYGMGWVSRTATVSVDVEAPTSAEGANITIGDGVTVSATFDAAYNGTVQQHLVAEFDPSIVIELDNRNSHENLQEQYAPYYGKYTKVEFTATGLPEGLSMSSDGVITGTLKEVGEVNVLITATYTKVDRKTAYREGWPYYSYFYAEEVRYGMVTFNVTGGFNVTLDGNGGTSMNIGVATGSTLQGADIDFVPEREGGYVFKGWALAADATEVIDLSAVSYNEATTLYAVWDEPIVSVVNGNLWLNGKDTGITLEGMNGADGSDGADGNDGVGILSIQKTSSEGLVDTYTIILSNGETCTFNITNGANGADGADGLQGAAGVAGPQGERGENGSDSGMAISIVSIALTCVAVIAVGAIAFVVLRKKNTD